MSVVNYVDSTGLVTQTRTEIFDALVLAFQTIYGTDIALGANSPDRQMIEILTQAKIDMLEVAADVYNSFNPDAAVGRALDSRVSINGIKRNSATPTRTMVSVTVDRALDLPGSDTSTTPFTVADSAGNKFALDETVSLTTGTHSLAFTAVVTGLIDVVTNNVTTISTITLGVTAVNNPTAPYQTGTDEETDPELRLRRLASVSLPSLGFLGGLQGGLKSVSGVTDAIVYENNTGTTNGYGIPAHSIWAIVDGGTNADIAAVINTKRNAGCGMRGTVTVPTTQVNGTVLNIAFDRPITENLYISLHILSLDVNHSIDADYLKQAIFDGIQYSIYEPADYTAITTLVKTKDPLAVVTTGGVSTTAGSYQGFIYPTSIQHKFVVSKARIEITGSI